VPARAFQKSQAGKTIRCLLIGGTMQTLQDLRYGLRMLLNKPGFAVIGELSHWGIESLSH
jgi:hypothetical protein